MNGKRTTEFDIDQSRRQLLGRAVATPLLLLGVAAAARAAKPAGGKQAGGKQAAAAATCVDMNALTASQQSLRDSLGFKLETPDPKQHCSLCAFFTATDGGCGKCELLTGGPVGANSVCDSFAAKS